MSFIAYQNVAAGSPVSSVDFTSNVNLSNYFQIVFDSALCSSSTTNSYIILQISDDAGSTWKTANYVNNLIPSITSGMIVGLLHDGSLGASYAADGNITINNLYWGVGNPTVTGTYNSFSGSGTLLSSQVIGGAYNGTPLVGNGLRLKSSDGNTISGNFYLYGN